MDRASVSCGDASKIWVVIGASVSGTMIGIC
jgi:hypothetical protein